MELRQVDALLADTKRSRFAARSVSSIEDPDRLAKLIPTEGWIPVDAKIRVTAVADLVSKLGGEALYGKDSLVPLRELIQNAADAVRARRSLEKRPPSWGEIIVRYGSDSGSEWIEVADSGIGMSPNVLAGPLLDFGTSFWKTDLVLTELPGLQESGFEPIGTYGIGFFSVFIWGRRVRVVTRRFEASREDTWILEFSQGLHARPLLRKAEARECLQDAGTVVRVWSDKSELMADLLESDSRIAWSFGQRCAWLCPALDVDLLISTKGQAPALVVRANDWLSIHPEELFRRLFGPDSRDEERRLRIPENIDHNVVVIKDGEEVVGRACIVSPRSRLREFHVEGVVAVGGFRSSYLTGIAGVLVGRSSRAARDVAVPVISPEVLAKFASEQALLVPHVIKSLEEQCEAASIIYACGGDTAGLPVALTKNGWVNVLEIVKGDWGPRVLLLQDAALFHATRGVDNDIVLDENVFVVSVGVPGILQVSKWSDFPDWPPERILEFRSLENLVRLALANAWSVNVQDLVGSSDKQQIVAIGTRAGAFVKLRASVVLRPPRQEDSNVS